MDPVILLILAVFPLSAAIYFALLSGKVPPAVRNVVKGSVLALPVIGITIAAVRSKDPGGIVYAGVVLTPILALASIAMFALPVRKRGGGVPITNAGTSTQQKRNVVRWIVLFGLLTLLIILVFPPW